jgi:hypothetical protein
MEYQIVRAYDSLDNLAESVIVEIGEGWKPQGGMCLERVDGMGLINTIYYQAMTKEQTHAK